MQESHEQTNASMDAHQVHHTPSRSSIFYVSLTRLDPDAVSMTTPAPPVSYDTWRAQMQRVHDEMERVRALNAPWSEKNRILSKEHKQAGGVVNRNGLLAMPFHAEDWIRPFVMREERHSAALAKKRPEEWARDIRAIEDRNLREAVARIVWWDFFSHRPCTNPWPHLDRYLDGEYVKIDKEALKRGLAQAGYSPWHAHRRLNATFDYAREGPNGKDHGRHLRRKQKVSNIFHNFQKKASA